MSDTIDWVKYKTIRTATDTAYDASHHPVVGVYYCFEHTESLMSLAFCLNDRERQQLYSDYQMAMLAKTTQLRNKTMATEYYDHFFDKSGSEKTVDIDKLFKANPYIEKVFHYRVRERLDAGITEGINYNTKDDLDVDVPQAYYEDEDWWFALGSVNLEWRKKDENTVWVFFKNEYRWHPDDKRASQSLHIALDRLEKNGMAKNFSMVGGPVLVTIPSKLVKPPGKNSSRPEGNQ